MSAPTPDILTTFKAVLDRLADHRLTCDAGMIPETAVALPHIVVTLTCPTCGVTVWSRFTEIEVQRFAAEFPDVAVTLSGYAVDHDRRRIN